MPDRKGQNSNPKLSSTSYVYPVKSLFDGRIQPHSEISNDIPIIQDNQGQIVPDALPDSPVDASSGVKTTTRRQSSFDQPPESRPRGRKQSPNYRHFPAEENPSFPRTFASKNAATLSTTGNMETVSLALSPDQVFGRRHVQQHLSTPPHEIMSPFQSLPLQSVETSRFVADRTLSTLVIDLTDQPPPEIPRNLSGIDQPSSSSTEVPHPSIATFPSSHEHAREPNSKEDAPVLPFNPSQYGLVHLPPLPSSAPGSERAGSIKSTGPRSVTSQGHSSRDGTQSTRYLSATSSMAGSGQSDRRSQGLSRLDPAAKTKSSQSQILSSNSSGTDNSLGSEEYQTTFKFQYRQDENGHHVVIGREGKLQRCEDEPIRTPGAVQGFGVLIAVDEKEDILVVRQVSENSTELLGLPPRYLFGLECFTDVLPESQVGVLWDNIQFLSEPEAEDEDGPHVFLLNGFGAPGSAYPHEGESDDGKRTWTCWCAVHRAPAHGESGAPGMIVMELELERDTLNPLYPPVTSQQSSGFASPSYSQSGSSTAGSEQTLIGRHENVPSPGPDRSVDGSPSVAENSPSPMSNMPVNRPPSLHGLDGDDDWTPSAEDILESTTSRSKPLPALERLRRMTNVGAADLGTPGASAPGSGYTDSRGRRAGRRGRGASAVGMMDVFAVMAQINEQLGAAPDVDTFLKIVVGVIKDLTQFHRVMVYQFDEMWNGQVTAELVDWSQSHDLFMGLHFPAGDIPAQARELYAINKVRLLYDRAQPTARIVVRSKEDIEIPLNMTQCFLRAMSPIHIKYLGNMGVRASMSVSIMAFGQLWGLVTCHSYGSHGMRVSFLVRQMLRLLSQSISKNIERLSYAQRLHTRKLINTMASDSHPTGYIVSNADDLLGLFGADFGILVIGEGAKILGPNQYGQEILIMAEYLRLKQYDKIQASQAVAKDFPDLQLTTGFEIIAGLLYVPLSSGGKDFIAFLRKGQPRQVRWAGKPYKDGQDHAASLEPRKSFKTWSEIVAGRCRAWTDEHLDTAGVLALVYGKFIEVWRQKENALQTTKLTDLLLSNASHEGRLKDVSVVSRLTTELVRTPLNHIINYLEMALNGPLDLETRDNLSRSHAASKSLLFTINDLLDLTRLESGNETSFNEPFDLHFAIKEATRLYHKEAERRDITFSLDLDESPTIVVGDSKKIRTVVQNLTANALKYTTVGSITVCCTTFGEPEGLRRINQIAVEIVVADTGCGISPGKLESIFREFEKVETLEPKSSSDTGVGLGLAVVARIVEQLGGQLRVNSKVNEGSKFSFLIPLSLAVENMQQGTSQSSGSSRASSRRSHPSSLFAVSGDNEIENLVQALAANHMSGLRLGTVDNNSAQSSSSILLPRPSSIGHFEATETSVLGRAIKTEELVSDKPVRSEVAAPSLEKPSVKGGPVRPSLARSLSYEPTKLRVLIVEDNDINRTILAKRLTMSGHTVINTTNGQEGLDRVAEDRAFDLILMDIQMPILNGFESTRGIRSLEKEDPVAMLRLSQILNGRIPIFAVSASLQEQQHEELAEHGMDGWILKPIDFKRLNVILRGITDPVRRHMDVYHQGCSWEAGGWLKERHTT